MWWWKIAKWRSGFAILSLFSVTPASFLRNNASGLCHVNIFIILMHCYYSWVSERGRHWPLSKLDIFLSTSSGAQPALHSGGGQFSMTSLCLFNRVTSFSQTVTYNNNVFLPRRHEVHSIQTHTFCTTLVNKNRTFYNSVGGWIKCVKRNFWLHVMCACAEQHSTCKTPWENWWLGLGVSV